MDRPLRFCMITTFYPPYNFGGDGVFVHRLANELARRGHRVDVIHCIDAYRLAGGGEPLESYDNHSNVTVHGLKSRLGVLSPLATQQTGIPFFKSSAITAVLRQGFDVIHYHNVSLFGPKVLEYGRAIKLYTMHEYWLVCPTHALFRYNRAACARPRCLPCTLSYKRPPQWWRYTGLLKAAAENVDAFIAPSRFCAEKHSELGFTAPIVHLPHFFPATDEPASPDPAADVKAIKPYFLFVGRLEKLKGLQTLIPVFRNYGKAELRVVGTGSYERELRRLAGDNADIRFLGFCSEERLRPLYRDAVAVIVPSLCFETFGQVIVEAFSQKTPALVRNLGAMPEMIAASGGGSTYDSDAELVAALEALLQDASRRQTLGQNGYQAYLRNWTAEVHLARYLRLIDKIAATKASGSGTQEDRNQWTQ